jgi:hypothetical protein
MTLTCMHIYILLQEGAIYAVVADTNAQTVVQGGEVGGALLVVKIQMIQTQLKEIQVTL